MFTEVSVQPTAHTLFDETAATLTSWEEVSPLELVEPLGAGTMLHAEPSQCSVTALLNGSAAFGAMPTAQTSLVATAATPLKET